MNLLNQEFATEAPNKAWFRRKPDSGLIFHSDRGSQYASKAFANQIEVFEMRHVDCTPWLRHGYYRDKTISLLG